MSLPVNAFWENRTLWPEDQEGHVFLARAVLLVGQHLFPNDWRDIDAAVAAPELHVVAGMARNI